MQALTDTGDIVVALIGLAGVIITAGTALIVSLRKARAENRDQHAAASRERRNDKDELLRAIGRVDGKVDVLHGDVTHLGDRLDRHLEDHERRASGLVRTRSDDD